MAFVRCLTPDVVEALGADPSFAPAGWQVLRVADETQTEKRTITADQAVERRESKGDALLLLIDTERAGAGMDGIYSASREVDEATLFRARRSDSRATQSLSDIPPQTAATRSRRSERHGDTAERTVCRGGRSSIFSAGSRPVTGHRERICICSDCGPFWIPRMPARRMI